MPRRRKFPDLVERCRICLVRDRCMSDIFSETTRPNFADLGACTSIEIINNPGLPKNVCHVCLYKLEMWSEFKTQFIKSNNILLYHYKINDHSEPQIKKKIVESGTILDNYPKEDDKTNVLLTAGALDEPMVIEENEIIESELKGDSKLKVLSSLNLAAEKMSDIKEGSGCEDKPSDNSFKAKSSVERRSRTNERRKASTKRWVERKKALIAATGEPVSETESSAEDEPKLSPVQKARAKTNLEKEAEKRKRLERALKNLETNMSGAYKIKLDNTNLILNEGSDERQTRSRKTNQEDVKSSKVRESKANTAESNEMEVKIKQDEVEFELTMDTSENIADVPVTEDEEGELTEVEDVMLPENINVNRFPPQQVQSEIQLDNATYVVTSVLSYVDTPDVKSNGLNVNEVLNGSNTDIIDAVQLKRINPKNPNKKVVIDLERCLNIEVEGTEVEALQRAQLELANYLEKDIRLRLKTSDIELSKVDLNTDSKVKDSYETLDLQLKTIVEKVIKKNYDTDKIQKPRKDYCKSILESVSEEKVSPADFIKIASKSKAFQPKVLLTRLNFGRITRKYRVNNLHILENVKRAQGLVGPLSQTLSKRRTVLPARYSDFKLEFEDNESRKSHTDVQPKSSLGFVSKLQKMTIPLKSSTPTGKTVSFNNRPQTLGKNLSSNTLNAAASTPTIPVNLVSPVTPVTTLKTARPVTPSTPTSSLHITSTNTLQKVVKSARSVKNVMNKPADKVFMTKIMPAEITKIILPDGKKVTGSEPQKTIVPELKQTILPEPKKLISPEPIKSILPEPKKLTLPESKKLILPEPKKLVEPRKLESKVTPQLKKSNVENEAPKNSITRQRHVCGLCRKEFDTKVEAEAHVRSHSMSTTQDQTKTKQKMMRCKRCHEIVEARLVRAHVCGSSKFTCKLCPATFGSESLLATHTAVHEAKKAEQTAKPKQSYTCFVCDKIFIDEEELKDHLQKHCDEMSEDEQTPQKEQFQCAICGNTLKSEEALESHVEQHLFGDEDDNPDLITIANEAKGKVEQSFACTKCTQRFTSQLRLAMHISEHEEEEAFAEWEKKKGDLTLHHVCMICDETFDSVDNLAEHQESHNGNELTCILCEVSFASLEELQNHVASHL